MQFADTPLPDGYWLDTKSQLALGVQAQEWRRKSMYSDINMADNADGLDFHE